MLTDLYARSAHRREKDSDSYLDSSGFVLRRLKVPQDIVTLHDWFTQDYAKFWLMQDKTPAEIAVFYQRLLNSGSASAYMGLREGQPAFLAECYDPFHDRIGRYYSPQFGDLGMHFIVGPMTHHVPGYTRSAFRALMCFMFQHLGARRIVVEPDINNHKIHALNLSVGFSYDREILLGDKVASLAFCTREQFEDALKARLKEGYI